MMFTAYRHILILVLILIVAGAVRIVGLSWDQYTAGHPDERFVASITAKMGRDDQRLATVQHDCDDSSFWDTACSAYNPHNLTESRFAYGTLPLFIVNRVAVIVSTLTKDDQWRFESRIPLVSRAVNAVADVITTLFVFLIAGQLFAHKQALLAAFLYALAVLPIQLSHFGAVDTIGNMFFVVLLFTSIKIQKNDHWLWYVLAGLASGAAAASRANLVVAAILIPIAGTLYFSEQDKPSWGGLVWLLMIFAGAFLVLFRLGQPYAFASESLFDIFQWPRSGGLLDVLKWNRVWREELTAVAGLSTQASSDWPPAYQWYDRAPYLYPWWNMVWGMGFGLWGLGTLGMLMLFWRQIRKLMLLPQIGLVSLWFLLYFAWQGQLHVMTMRYFLPLYSIWILASVWGLTQLSSKWRRVVRVAVVISSGLWCFAFLSIYIQPQTRVQATHWMRDHVPATVALTASYETPTPVEILLIQDQSLENSMLILESNPTQGVDLLFSPFYLSQPQELERVWLQFLDENMPTTARMTLYRDDVFFAEWELAQDDENTMQTENTIFLDSGRYFWRLQISPTNREQVFYVLLGADWQQAATYVALPTLFDMLSLEDIWATVPFYGLSAETPLVFNVNQDMRLQRIQFAHQLSNDNSRLVLTDGNQQWRAELESSQTTPTDILGDFTTYYFEEPVQLRAGRYELYAEHSIWVTGSTIATEGQWNESIPARICWHEGEDLLIGYIDYDQCTFASPFDLHWYTELPLNMAAFDNDAKIRRIQAVLRVSDYITVASNRMYDALPRYPEQFQWSTHYYAALFDEAFGFVQRERFSMSPQIGFMTIPDQALPDDPWPQWLNALEAEEAFTVYDHPTIYIFENRNFQPQNLPDYLP